MLLAAGLAVILSARGRLMPAETARRRAVGMSKTVVMAVTRRRFSPVTIPSQPIPARVERARLVKTKSLKGIRKRWSKGKIVVSNP
jgi:hypothetical protein